MRDLGGALALGLRTPLVHWRLALVLWLARLLPVLLLFTLPVYGAAHGQLAKHPDARALLDAPADGTGFAFAWTGDFFREGGAGERVFPLILFTWLLVTLLAGGITARLVHRRPGPLLAECGRYAGRFLRLALVALFLAYVADLAVNGLLREAHAETARTYHVRAYEVQKEWARGVLFLALLFLVGAVHSYARIEMVANERRSAALTWVRAVGTLLLRLPKLLLLEIGMLLALAAAAVVAFLLMRPVSPLGTTATGLSLGLFVLLAAVGSYLRTGLELGTLAARARLLAPPPPPEPSLFETVAPAPEAEPEEYDLPPENPPA